MQSKSYSLSVSLYLVASIFFSINSARVQKVQEQANQQFHKLLVRFKELISCSIVVNISFNLLGGPTVCRPEDAFRCFMGTKLDILIVGNTILQKAAQKRA